MPPEKPLRRRSHEDVDVQQQQPSARQDIAQEPPEPRDEPADPGEPPGHDRPCGSRVPHRHQHQDHDDRGQPDGEAGDDEPFSVRCQPPERDDGERCQDSGHAVIVPANGASCNIAAARDTEGMRDFAVPFLLAFIAGVAVAAVAGWFLRDRIRERMARRRRGGS